MQTTISHKPLVTFVLFAYNQEDYVGLAISSAFAQTYEPLEIVLSDDCSSDATYLIMQTMAAAYNCPNSVRVVRSERNLGVLSHVISRGREASGDIVICAAGDDVSLPNRTECLVSRFGPDTGAVYSLVSIIDETGNVLSPLAERPLHMAKPTVFLRYSTNEHEIVQGCSASYRRWVFDVPVDPNGKKYAEDPLFSLYINLKGSKIHRLDSPLVQYRQHPKAISNTSNRRISTQEREAKSLADAKAALQWLDDVEKVAASVGNRDQLDYAAIKRRRSEASELVEWTNLSLASRLRRMLTTQQSIGSLPAKWKLARLFGRCPNYQPKALFDHLRNWR